MDESTIRRLIELDHAHVWHPFTPMRQWRQSDPVIIERGEDEFLIDVHGKRYIDGVSSLWCNVHGHRVRAIDDAVRAQLGRIAHSTMLGLSNVPAIQLAEKLCQIAPGQLKKVFYSDAGATATEVAFKMAVGHWHHRGQPRRNTFIALSGAYHGDTTGAMSVGYSDLFHRPFKSMTFHVEFVPAPKPDHESSSGRGNQLRTWFLENPSACESARDLALAALDEKLAQLADRCAAVVIEPLVQGAAGMIVQPPGYISGVESLCRKYGVLLIADEVATGFGRTGRMFACEHENVRPDILCLGKGLSGGYLPLAATLCTDQIAQSFEGELHEFKTLYHGHTFTGNPLGCAAALASLELFERNDLLAAVREKSKRLAAKLDPLRDPERFPRVIDVRQCGLMLGIELQECIAATSGRGPASPSHGGPALGDFGETLPLPSRERSAESSRSQIGRGGPGEGETPDHAAPPLAYHICQSARAHGLIIRPLGNVIVLMPPLAIRPQNLDYLADVVLTCLTDIKS